MPFIKILAFPHLLSPLVLVILETLEGCRSSGIGLRIVHRLNRPSVYCTGHSWVPGTRNISRVRHRSSFMWHGINLPINM